MRPNMNIGNKFEADKSLNYKIAKRSVQISEYGKDAIRADYGN